MAKTRVLTALGLMSGTSMDGIDAAVVRTDGECLSSLGPWTGIAYDPIFRERLRGALGRRPDPVSVADRSLADELTQRHADVVRRLLVEARLDAGEIDVVGFHGHTVFHDPRNGVTCQIGDGEVLAAAIGIPVVCDFRAADVAAGGEGAPFAPLFHRALAEPLEKPIAILNLGGVGNVTWIGSDGATIAFDTGPGNAMIDDWTRATIGRPMDEDGRLARAGTIERKALARLLEDTYFARPGPKSLDREHFDASPVGGLSPADGAATLTRFTAESVAFARAHFPAPPSRWLVTGGGRKNSHLMTAIRHAVGAPVDPVEAVGWEGDAIEAQAFAYLAVRSVHGMALSLPTTTGVSAPMPGGVLHPAPGRRNVG